MLAMVLAAVEQHVTGSHAGCICSSSGAGCDAICAWCWLIVADNKSALPLQCHTG